MSFFSFSDFLDTYPATDETVEALMGYLAHLTTRPPLNEVRMLGEPLDIPRMLIDRFAEADVEVADYRASVHNFEQQARQLAPDDESIAGMVTFLNRAIDIVSTSDPKVVLEQIGHFLERLVELTSSEELRVKWQDDMKGILE